jgi:hypothetical protein
VSGHRSRVSFAEHTRDFIQWAKANHRSWAKDDSRLSRVTPVTRSWTKSQRQTLQELGGWKTLGMVQRYAHLAPSHLRAAVERLVPTNAMELARN